MSGIRGPKKEEEEDKKPVIDTRGWRTQNVPLQQEYEDYEEEYDDESAQGHINLKVKAQDGSEVFFRIKRITQLKMLMKAYCDQRSVAMNAIAFLFDGRRIGAEQTPYELWMEDGDEIDAMLHQTGGASTF